MYVLIFITEKNSITANGTMLNYKHKSVEKIYTFTFSGLIQSKRKKKKTKLQFWIFKPQVLFCNPNLVVIFR